MTRKKAQRPVAKENVTKKEGTFNSKKSKPPPVGKLQDLKQSPVEPKHHDTHKSSSPCFVQTFLNKQSQLDKPFEFNLSSQKVLLGLVSRLHPFRTISHFDRRVTTIAWHPLWPNVMSAGSKGGDILWWNLTRPDWEQQIIPGVGPGGSITAMKFSTDKPNLIYTSSITGKIMLQDFEGKQSKCFIDTLTWENWFTSLDIEPGQNLLATGDTKGYLYLMSSKDGTLVWKVPKKIHKSKISHLEFHPLHPDLLVTSSVDHTVKLWDMRKMGNMKDTINVLQHTKGVSSANFSPNAGTQLLTTDQHSELRVFQGPAWQSQITIPHPHRQFQHLTPIKATWHPSLDVIAVGRYPDSNFQEDDIRSIDFFDGHTGNLCYQLTSPYIPGIVSLNQFNMSGDILASAMGFHVVVWKTRDDDDHIHWARKMTTEETKGNKTLIMPQSNGPRRNRANTKVPSPQKKLKIR